MHSFVIFSAMWKVQHEFSIFWKLQCRFITKNDLKFSTKLEVKSFMFHNVQGEYRAVIALKWFAPNLVFSWSVFPEMRDDKNHTVCHAKNVKNHAWFVIQKMSKIPLLLWKDFGQNFRLAEGLWSIPCLMLVPSKNENHKL